MALEVVRSDHTAGVVKLGDPIFGPPILVLRPVPAQPAGSPGPHG